MEPLLHLALIILPPRLVHASVMTPSTHDDKSLMEIIIFIYRMAVMPIFPSTIERVGLQNISHKLRYGACFYRGK